MVGHCWHVLVFCVFDSAVLMLPFIKFNTGEYNLNSKNKIFNTA